MATSIVPAAAPAASPIPSTPTDTSTQRPIQAAGAHLFTEELVGWFSHMRALPFVQVGDDNEVLSYWHEPFPDLKGKCSPDDDTLRDDWGMRAAAAYFIYVQRTAVHEHSEALLVSIIGDMPRPLSESARCFLRHLEHLHWLHGTEVSSRQIADDVEAEIEERHELLKP